jgi:hypothetical protein
VKAKQGKEWLRVQAPREGDFVILVDLQKRTSEFPPEFYVLILSDWKALIASYSKSKPQIQVDSAHCVTWPDGWKGLNLTVERVHRFKGQWEKLPGTLVDGAALSPV